MTQQEESWEDEFNSLFWYLPADVQDRLRSMHDHDFALMRFMDDKYIGVAPDGEAARALALARAGLVKGDRETFFPSAMAGPPAWRDMADLAADMLLLALGRARREEAGQPWMGEGYERPTPTDADPPAEQALVEALLRYRFGRLIEQNTSTPYELALVAQRHARMKAEPEDEDDAGRSECDAIERRRKFTLIDGGTDE